MYQYAQILCKGYKAADFLIATLDNWLKDNYVLGFSEELVHEVATLFQGQGWVQSAQTMQATLDKDLIQLIRAKDIKTLLDNISNPSLHNTNVTTRLIKTKVQECFDRVATTIYLNIKQCITTTATATSNVNVNRSAQFVGTNSLVKNLPKADDAIMNCNEQGPLIFSTSRSLNILSAILDSLKSVQSKVKPSGIDILDIASDVLEIIRNETQDSNLGVIPRCGQICPMCGCPCTKDIDHISSSEDDEIPHDTYHQPVRLCGRVYDESKKLVGKSCVQSTIDNVKLVLEDGTKIPYKQFNKAFPFTWVIPHVNQNLPLREYIFANFQVDLAIYYNKPKCSSIPRKYFHDINDIARQIDQLLMGSNVYYS
ncbi:hypothetical protein THRCLA_22726 [Thraustotheca clavata]|uniref:Uncharacterized protein n=1 Tax=Thraustotheca clavata TaxID=74557 RepID=A0A1V9YU24_9STRA|nr:hypothetical protein THRCLA_22726 [Thraustotheca clavata]